MMVSASTKQSTRPELAAAPALRAAAHVPPTQRNQSHADVIGEDAHDGRRCVIALIVHHDDLEGGIGQPKIAARDARSLDHTRENRLQDLTNQRLLVSRGYHDGETRLSHALQQ